MNDYLVAIDACAVGVYEQPLDIDAYAAGMHD
jgi:hypothetical protein